ncbi:MAG: alpha/beta hydrolase [Bacteroidota bacterium]
MKFLIFPLMFLMSSAGAYKFISKINSQPENFNFITFQSQGQKLQMAYQYRKADHANGKTVVLLHGKNFSSAYWKETMYHLSKEGYDVLAPDQVGFGRSSQPLTYQFSFEQLAENTKLLMDSLHIRSAVVVGHSMGGMLAVRLALMYPEMCTKLILENPIGLEDYKTTIPYSTIDKETDKELVKTRKDRKEYMTKNYFHGEWKQQYEPLLDESELLRGDKLFPAYARNMALTTDMIFTQPVCYEFKNLKVPVTLIIGQSDRTAVGKERVVDHTQAAPGNYPELGKKADAIIKNSKLIELPGIGHIPHIENFPVFIAQLDPAIKELNLQ